MKSKKTSVLAITAIAAMLAVVSVAGIPESSAVKTKMYEVTITNLTPGQPLTPPLLVTHSLNAGFFTVGEMAGVELQQLAENGNAGLLVDMLDGKAGIADIVEGSEPLVPANTPGSTNFGHSATFVISAEGNMKYLSFASMLICTNDGFTGIDSIKLPGNSKTIYAEAYDARTEMNTEDFADMVPPCQGLIGVSSDDVGTGQSNSEIAEDGVISHHLGIIGGDDLRVDIHGWENPVVKIDIVQMK